jgi:hypothetical protein
MQTNIEMYIIYCINCESTRHLFDSDISMHWPKQDILYVWTSAIYTITAFATYAILCYLLFISIWRLFLSTKQLSPGSLHSDSIVTGAWMCEICISMYELFSSLISSQYLLIASSWHLPSLQPMLRHRYTNVTASVSICTLTSMD